MLQTHQTLTLLRRSSSTRSNCAIGILFFAVPNPTSVPSLATPPLVLTLYEPQNFSSVRTAFAEKLKKMKDAGKGGAAHLTPPISGMLPRLILRVTGCLILVLFRSQNSSQEISCVVAVLYSQSSLNILYFRESIPNHRHFVLTNFSHHYAQCQTLPPRCFI